MPLLVMLSNSFQDIQNEVPTEQSVVSSCSLVVRFFISFTIRKFKTSFAAKYHNLPYFLVGYYASTLIVSKSPALIFNLILPTATSLSHWRLGKITCLINLIK